MEEQRDNGRIGRRARESRTRCRSRQGTRRLNLSLEMALARCPWPAGRAGGRNARRKGLDNPADLGSASTELDALMDSLTSPRSAADPPPPASPNLSIWQKMSTIRSGGGEGGDVLPSNHPTVAGGKEGRGKKKEKEKSGIKGKRKMGIDLIRYTAAGFLASLSSLTKVKCKGGES